jgi:hypothetical protein
MIFALFVKELGCEELGNRRPDAVADDDPRRDYTPAGLKYRRVLVGLSTTGVRALEGIVETTF